MTINDIYNFFQAILPTLHENQAYVYFGLRGNDRRQLAAQSIKQLFKYGYNYSKQGYNSYFALGSFGYDSNNGVKISRTKDNAIKFKSIWADIDVGKAGCRYQSQREALASVLEFVKATGIKPTYVITSGKGLHVYWCFKDELSGATLVRIQKIFKQVCKDHDLDVDSTRATDIASVLRIPGTTHQSSQAPVGILLQGQVWETSELVQLIGANLKTPVSVPKSIDTSSLSSVFSPNNELFETCAGMVENCQQIKNMGSADYKTWFCAISALKNFRDGLNYAHKLSCNDPRYDALDLNKKWESAGNQLPVKCETFRECNIKGCYCCPFANEVKTPIALHNMESRPMVVVDEVPFGIDADEPSNDTEEDINAEKNSDNGSNNSSSSGNSSNNDWLFGVEEKKTEEVKPVVNQDKEPVKQVVSATANPLNASDDDVIDIAVADMKEQEILSDDSNKVVAPLDLNKVSVFEPINFKSTKFKVDNRGIVRVITKSKLDSTTNTVKYETVEDVLTDTQLYLKYRVMRMDEKGRPKQGYMFKAVYSNGYSQDLLAFVDEDFVQGKLVRWLANGLIHLNVQPNGRSYSEADIMAFFNTMLKELCHKVPELPTFNSFGWNSIHNIDGTETPCYITGAGAVTANGIVEYQPGKLMESHKEQEFTKKGDINKWKLLPQMYRILDQKAGQLAVCLSFAAPLMKYGAGEAKSALFSIFSHKSGQGKSHLLRVCGSIFGNPYKQFFTRMESSVARARRLAIWNNMPAMMDELTDVKDEDLYGLAYTLTGGKEKNKLRSSGEEFVKTGEWSTVVITSANKSFKEAISHCAGDSEATLQRVMEVECEFPDYSNNARINQYIKACEKITEDNYGLAGPEFVYQVLNRPERLETLTARASHWCEKVGFASKERYMGYPLALALIAGRWAVEFGLLDYDMDELEKWVIDTFVSQNRDTTNKIVVNLDDLLGNYFADRRSGTLVVQCHRRNTATAPMSRDEEDDYILSPPAESKSLVARYNMDEGDMEVSQHDLENWCKKKNVSVYTLLQHLKVLGVTPELKRMNLGRCVRWIPTTNVKAYVFSKLDLIKLGFDFSADDPDQVQ